jgi:hypothetical protein
MAIKPGHTNTEASALPPTAGYNAGTTTNRFSCKHSLQVGGRYIVERRGRGFDPLRSNFIINIGYGDETKLFPRSPRLAYEEIARFA